MGRERTERERRAADELAEGVRREAERFFDAVAEEINRDPKDHRSEPELLSEQEADALALVAVHRSRRESPREAEDRPPGEAEVRAWSEDRERDRMEGETARSWRPTPPR